MVSGDIGRIKFDSQDPPKPDDAVRLSDARSNDNPRLLAAVKEYLSALEAGSRPSRREWLARYSDIAKELSECLDGLAFVHSAAGRLGHGPSHATTAETGAEVVEGRPLGDFQLLREIGRGGMGVVYEAIQLSLERRVAVKVLPLAAALDSRHLQRFKHEAHAAAQLHHTNIVPVYAVGCERAVHFYAMQFIEGQSLADVISVLRRQAGRESDQPVASVSLKPIARQRETALSQTDSTQPLSAMGSSQKTAPGDQAHVPKTVGGATGIEPAESLGMLRISKGCGFARTVASLGLQAADALDYAHRMGVVHRDIKPANLLLDVRGNLWVADFGLAQLYEDNGLTQTGDLVGTLRYMSPEQASGRAVVLDQRTDIYSLAITLYELVTLERALVGTTREQLLYQISSTDPAPVRSIDRTIPSELEVIIAKAAAKDPAERYPTARALADDLKRFLADEPILARPPTVWDKVVKWTRRHRALALFAVAMLSLTAVGLAITTLLIAREQEKTRTAYVLERDNAIEANKQSVRAQTNFALARQEVDFLTRVASEELAENPTVSDVRREMLEAALDYYRGFVDSHRDDPALSGQLAEAESRVSAILIELSAFETLDRVLYRLKLLTEPSVRRALGLSDRQTQQVEEINSYVPGRFLNTINPEKGSSDGTGQPAAATAPVEGARPRKSASEQRRESFSRLATDLETRLNNVLDASQAQRLRQISRQARGPAAFSDPDVLVVLDLTRSQRDAIHDAQVAFRTDERELLPRGGPAAQRGRPASEGNEYRRLEETSVRRILSQLNESQAAVWRDMTGEPFEGALLVGHFPGPPPDWDTKPGANRVAPSGP